MSIYKNLSDIFPKILNFEIKEHIDVDEIDEQVRKNLVIVFIKNEELYIEILGQITEMSKMISAFIKKIRNLRNGY
jgi:hypothetical protein